MSAAPRPPAVYAIADADALAPLPLDEGVAAMAGAGIEWIQVRAKRMPDDRLYAAAAACCRAAESGGARLWIDDRADLAALLPLAGVHLGQSDLPPAAARAAVGERWIGWSTHDLQQIAAADADREVDVVALGPIFPTRSKEASDPVVGLDVLRRARRLTGKPIVAIGGIDAGSLPAVLEAGADAAAVIGAVCRGDIEDNCRRLLAAARGGAGA